ncbi:MAG TPA: hypothetical protein VF627_12400 [Abditibacterium sp.]|jgi:hypothetical protein
MSLYNEGELQAAIADGERKLAIKRQQRRQQKKRLMLFCLALCVLVPFCIVAGAVASRAPSAPSLVVTWPKPKVRQVLAPGQTLLARAGQPFAIEVTDAENWNVTWKAADIESGGDEFNWAPSGATGELLASCRPVTQGWQRFFAWTWPTREIALKTLAAQNVGDYGRIVEAGASGAWVYPHIFASGTVRFDERTLPLLASAIPLVPRNELSHQLAGVSGGPTPRLWQIVADFEGRTDAAQSALDGTFAALHSPDVATALPRIAANIIETAPDASLKFVLRLDKDVPEGIVRLAFDGKRERRAWVRRAGEAAGGPFTGWENGAAAPGLPPSLPRE